MGRQAKGVHLYILLMSLFTLSKVKTLKAFRRAGRD